MQSQKRIFDDIAHVAGGALGAISGFKAGNRGACARPGGAVLWRMENFVRRDEFDAVKEMAAKARAEQERLTVRMGELEQALAKKNTEPNAENTQKEKQQEKREINSYPQRCVRLRSLP